MTEPNIPLLRKVLEWVEEQDALPYEQQQWRQGVWRSATMRVCGTAFCVAGYVCEQDPDTEWATDNCDLGWFDEVVATDEERAAGQLARLRPMPTTEASGRAQRLLGIGSYTAGELFEGSNSAARIRNILEEAVGEKL